MCCIRSLRAKEGSCWTRDALSRWFNSIWVGGTHGLGTIFKFALPRGPLTILHSFSGLDGSNPQSPLTFSLDGKLLYGATENGNVSAGVTSIVYSISTTGSDFKVLRSFSYGVDGTYISDGVFLSPDGKTLYGTTYYG